MKAKDVRIEGRLSADEMERVWNAQVDIREKGMGDGRGRGSQEEIGFGRNRVAPVASAKRRAPMS